jgi:hypothetical protein
VVGCEERTNAEQAQYRLLLHSLTVVRHAPVFVNFIWFPESIQSLEYDEDIDLSILTCNESSHDLENLNDSQREIVRAMASTALRDSLVIVHGIDLHPRPSFTQVDAHATGQGPQEQGRQPQSPLQLKFGHLVTNRAG